MVRSHRDYCSSVWAPYRIGDIEACLALEKGQKRAINILPALKQELIRRWDSERELFLWQHHTCRGQRLRPLNDFLISTKDLRYPAAHQTEFNVDSPIQPAAQHSGCAHCYKKLIRRHGRRQLQSEVEANAIASSCFAQILAEYSRRSY